MLYGLPGENQNGEGDWHSEVEDYRDLYGIIPKCKKQNLVGVSKDVYHFKERLAQCNQDEYETIIADEVVDPWFTIE